MNVRDAAAEIARGSIPPDVLEQAAALPLPPSRLSMFLDGRQPSSVSPAATGSRSNSRLQAQSPLPGMLEDTAFSEVLMLDRSNSMLVVPSRSSRSRLNTSDASRNISQSALGSQRRSRPPEIAARPNTSASTWRVAFSTSRRGKYSLLSWRSQCSKPVGHSFYQTVHSIQAVYCNVLSRPLWSALNFSCYN